VNTVARYISAGLLLTPLVGDGAAAQPAPMPSPFPEPNQSSPSDRTRQTAIAQERLLAAAPQHIAQPEYAIANLRQTSSTLRQLDAAGIEQLSELVAAIASPELLPVRPESRLQDLSPMHWIASTDATTAPIERSTDDAAATEPIDRGAQALPILERSRDTPNGATVAQDNESDTIDVIDLNRPESADIDDNTSPDNTSPDNTSPDNTDDEPNDRRVEPRLGIGHTSSGGGYDGTTRIESFFPIGQTLGRDVGFGEARLLIDNDGQVGSNLVLGYRTFDEGSDRTFGGYIAYDHRDTGDSSFNQIGLGIETLGTDWDARLNGYIPVGDQRNVINEGFIDTFFQDQSLLLTNRTDLEAAMGGIDFEAGGRIARLSEEGDLRGYGGLYWYDAPGSPSTVGWRLRLEARPTDTVNLGVALQDDSLFGTNVIFNVGVTFPNGTRPRGLPSEPETALARLGENVGRNSSIVVDHQTELDNIIATNPETGLPYVFQHVDLGSGAGNGTIENPYGTVAPALVAAESDGNHIVYVQAGTDPGIPGFTIPDEVDVLSTGPVQFVDTVENGIERLPLSGSGEFPLVTDTVRMGNNTTLSGFTITGTTGAGVVVQDVENAVIRDNAIRSTVDAGVLLRDTFGITTLDNNRIVGDGVAVIDGLNVGDVTIANSQLVSRGSDQNGWVLQDVVGDVSMTDSRLTITNPTENGILIGNVDPTGSVTIAADPGQITTNQPDQAGIALVDNQGDITLSGLTVNSTNGPALSALNQDNTLTMTDSTLNSTNSTTNGIALDNITGTVTITDTAIAIENPATDGLLIRDATGDVAIAATTGQITTATPDQSGISLLDNTGAVTLSGFTVDSTNGPALSAVNQNTLTMTDSALNSTDSTTNGITLDNITGSATITDTAIAIENPATDGLSITNSAGDVTIAATPGTITTANPDQSGIFLDQNTGTVSLSGFDATSDQGSALSVTDTNAVTIADSTLTSTNAPANGITLERVNQVDITNTAINLTAPTENGILIDQVDNATISATPGSTIANSGAAGVQIQDSGTVAASGLTINNAGTDGIAATTTTNVTLDNNTINSATDNGINLSDITGTTAVTNSTIANSGLDGIVATNVTGTATVSNTIVSDAGQTGIAFTNDAGALDLTLTENQVTNSGDRGVLLNMTNAAELTALVENNTISGSPNDGLAVIADGTSAIATGIRFNTLTDNAAAGTAGLNAVANDNSNICAQLRDNTSATVGVPGFNLQQNVGDPTAFDAEIGANNVGTLTTSGTEINSVAEGTCGFDTP
jgi:trimeric autotransporter adhesin